MATKATMKSIATHAMVHAYALSVMAIQSVGLEVFTEAFKTQTLVQFPVPIAIGKLTGRIGSG